MHGCYTAGAWLADRDKHEISPGSYDKYIIVYNDIYIYIYIYVKQIEGHKLLEKNCT